MSGHARCSASAAHRWLHCAGSLGESAPSEYAATGTHAHSIAALCLEQGKDAREFLGTKAVVDGFEVVCDEEMVDGVQLYVDHIREDLQRGDRVWVEMPLLDALRRIDPDMGGTADHVRYRPTTRHLKVTDLKYGAGTYVEVDDNVQAKIYALGAMMQVDQPVLDVELCIVQPRFEGAEPVRRWTFKAFEILDFAAECQRAAEATRQPNPPRVAGPHCKAFCPNARSCPELEKQHHALVAADFSDVTVYDPAKLAADLAAIPLVKERIKAIEEYAYKMATSGMTIPGFKLVEKVARRQYRPDIEAQVVALAKEKGVDPYTAPEVLSPAQLEKRLAEKMPKGQKKDAAKLVEPFVHKVSAGLALVPESDERAPAKLISVDDFDIIPAAQIKNDS